MHEPSMQEISSSKYKSLVHHKYVKEVQWWNVFSAMPWGTLKSHIGYFGIIRVNVVFLAPLFKISAQRRFILPEVFQSCLTNDDI
jgi:hypothetical protein